MLNTSGDILNIVLAISIATLTTFIVIVLYYLIASIKKVHNVAVGVEKGVQKIEELIDLLENKINSTSNYLIILTEFAKQLMSYFSPNSKYKKNKTKPEKNNTSKLKNKK